MKILFEIGYKAHLRHFQRVAEQLKKNGNKLIISASLEDSKLFNINDNAKNSRTVASRFTATRKDTAGEIILFLRNALDYIKFLDKKYDNSEVLKSRTRASLLLGNKNNEQNFGKNLANFIDSLNINQLNIFSDILHEAENIIPDQIEVTTYLKKIKPDLILISPLIFTQYSQFEFLKSAQQFNIPVFCLIFSWDNISSKGIFHIKPDKVFVWNEIQKKECVENGFKDSEIVITGAPRFDEYYEKKPTINKADFLKKYKFNSSSNVILYLCSSELISDNEPGFVKIWLENIFSSKHAMVKDANILIRPHPKFVKIWKDVNLSSFGNVALNYPDSLSLDDSLYDCIYHSAAVVGLNTSAQIEAGILNKPVLTLKIDGYSKDQTGTIHFGYLLEENGGFVELSTNFSDHLELLNSILEGKYNYSKIKTFINYFIRPNGENIPASNIMVNEIMNLLRK